MGNQWIFFIQSPYQPQGQIIFLYLGQISQPSALRVCCSNSQFQRQSELLMEISLSPPSALLSFHTLVEAYGAKEVCGLSYRSKNCNCVDVKAE